MLKKIPDSLYDLAFQYKETRLWKKLWDDELFAVKLEDGSIGYCCVMGKRGEHTALAIYPGDAGLDAYCLIACEGEMDEAERQDYVLRQDCVAVSFETEEFFASVIWAEICDYCARHGIVRRGAMKLPNFERMKPYRGTWYITDEADAAYIRAALEAALEVGERLKTATPKQLGFTRGEPLRRSIPLLTKTESGYTWSSIQLPEARTPYDYPKGYIDEFTLARLKKAKKSGHTWSACIFASPEPVMLDEFKEDERHEAPVYPFVLMMADETDQRILNVQVCQNTDEAELNKCFTDMLANLVLAEGRPSKLIAEGDRTRDFFSNICADMDIQIEFSDAADILNTEMYHFKETIENRFSADDAHDMDDMDPEEAIRQFTQILMDLDNCRELPDILLQQLAGLTTMGILPEEAVKMIESEMQRRGLQ